jgi:amidophosphoribosyltransferase
MINATRQPRAKLCTACFTGVYPIELPTADRLGKNLLERTNPADATTATGCDPGPDAEFEILLTPEDAQAADKKETV